MQLSEVRISLCGSQGGRLKAFCSLTFDNTFVIRDVKLIDGNDGLFLAMPSRKLCDRCKRCGDKNHLRARFCNGCGNHLNENRYLQYQTHSHSNGSHLNGASSRLKLHADIAHPINAECRMDLERRVLAAYREEIERSKQPGYVPTVIEDFADEYGEDAHVHPAHSPMHLRPTGTTSH